MKRLVILLIALLSVGLVSAANYTLEEDFSSYTGFNDGFGGTNPNSAYVANEFDATSNYDLGRVTVRLKTNNAPTWDVRAQLWSENAGYPGTLIATSNNTFTAAELTGTYAEYNFTFNATALTSGTTYWVAFSRVDGGSDGTNYYGVDGLMGGAATGKNTRRSPTVIGWLSWSSNWAYYMKVYSVVEPTPPAPSGDNYTWSAPSAMDDTFYQENSTSGAAWFKTNGTVGTNHTINYYYVNYTKPYGANMAYWQIKHGNASQPQTYNISLRDNNCWSDSDETVELRVYSYTINIGTAPKPKFNGTSWPECYNSTDWIFIGQNLSNSNLTIGTSYDSEIVSSNCLSKASDGNYNTWCSADDTPQWKKTFDDTTATNLTAASMLFEEGVWWNVSMDSVNFTYYDDTDNSSLSGTNVTIYGNSPETFFTNKSSVGYYGKDLNRHNWTLTYSADAYAQKIKYLYYETTIKNYMSNYGYGDTAEQPLYLLPLGDSTEVLMTVYEGIGQSLTGYVISANRFNLGTNTYTETENCFTDSNGQCLMHLELLNTTYRFVISKNGNIIFTSLDQRIYTNTLSFTVSTTANELATITNKFSAEGVITYDNSTNEVSYTYIDNQAALTGGCLEVTGYNYARATIISSECSTNVSGTITSTANASLYDRLEMTGWVIDSNGENFLLTKAEKTNYGIAETSGTSGLFIFGFIILGVVFFIGLWSPALAGIMGVGFLYAASYLQLINVGTWVIAPLMVVAIIIAWRLKQ